eukprot:gene21217-biopygen20647
MFPSIWSCTEGETEPPASGPRPVRVRGRSSQQHVAQLALVAHPVRLLGPRRARHPHK